MSYIENKVDLKRRKLIRGMAMVVPGSLLIANPTMSLATVSEKRSLLFHHLHTNEKLSIDYFSNNHYLSESLAEINYFLRDFRTGEEHSIDPKLLDILYQVQQKTGSRGKFEVISGFRSPATNEKLRNKSNGVAKRSLHMLGKAIDIRLTDVNISAVRNAATSLKSGGVGFYGRSNFVHLDTGRFRTW